MGDVVNLNRARKQRDRATKEAQAAVNRAKFGQPKAARKKAEALEAQATTRHDGHKLTTD